MIQATKNIQKKLTNKKWGVKGEEENPRSSGLLASMAGSLQVAYPLVILFEELAIEQVLVDENLGI